MMPTMLVGAHIHALRIWLSSRLTDWVNKLFYGYFLVMVNVSIPCSFTSATRAHALVGVGVRLRHFVPALAVSPSALHVGMRLHGFSKRILISGIQRLFSSRRPSTISRFVISIVVDSIKRKAERPIAHIRTKLLKASSPWRNATPLFANRNTATTPILVVRAVRIGAALNHACPSVVKRLFCFVSHSPSKERGIMITQYNGLLS